MDIPRQLVRRNHRWLYAALAVCGVAALAAALGRLKAAAPTVSRASVWVDTVRRGPMVRQVKGPGTLVPEQLRWVTAQTAGRVERILQRPGAAVTADTPLLELTNPDVVLQALEAERQLAEAEAEGVRLRTALESQKLSQAGQVATLAAERADAARRAEANRRLAEKDLVPELERKQTDERAAELAERSALAGRHLEVLAGGIKAQLAAQRAQVQRLQAVATFRRAQVEGMKVLAGEEGVLQELNLQPGQWVVPGTVLAKVVQPGRLKAELRVPETQARDLTVGQGAQVDTRNGLVAGKVTRIAPAASQGAVVVEVGLEGPLPKGARPDLSVEGTIELERLENVLFTGRPAGAQAEAVVELYRLTPGDDNAERTRVRLGRSSVNTIEVLEGLREGDKVVLSDASGFDNAARVRLK